MTLRPPRLLAVLFLMAAAGCVPPRSCPRQRCPEVRVPVVSGAPIGYEAHAPPGDRIVVAQSPLRAGTRLRTSLLKVVPKPRGLAWKGHLRPVDLVHFSGFRLRRDIRRGQAIRRGDLQGFVSGNRRRPRLPAGTRAVSIRVHWVGGAGTWVRAGDYVDVALISRKGRQGALAVRTLMQRAKVLDAQPWGGALRARRKTRWCSLLALPREAQALALARRLGRIVIFPRGSADRRRAVYQPVTRRDLEDPAFWKRLEKQRLRTVRRHGLPDDPGIGTK